MKKSLRVYLAAGLLLAGVLAGCGGGLEEEDVDVGVTAAERAEFAAAAADLSQPVRFLPGVLRLNFSRNPSAGGAAIPITVRIANPGGALFFRVTSRPRVLTDDPVGVGIGDRSNEYRISLPVRTDLRVGVHTGEIRLIVCRDLACTVLHPASGAILPYSITVTEEFKFTVTVSGAERDPTLPIVARNGAKVRITTTQPASWSESMGGAHFGSTQTTQTTFVGTVVYELPPRGKSHLSVRVIETHPGMHREFDVQFVVPPPTSP